MIFKSSYLGAPVFDVDSQTGFMAPSEPVSRLPIQWEPWEATLDAAILVQLQLGDKPGLTEQEATQSEKWRAGVRQVCLVSLNFFPQIIDANRRVDARYRHDHPRICCPSQACASRSRLHHAFLHPITSSHCGHSHSTFHQSSHSSHLFAP